MMKKFALIVSAGVFLILSSCTKEKISGNGSIITETRNVSNFTGVTASGSSLVYIVQGAAFKVEVKGYGNLLPYYETKVVNSNLEVGFKQNVNVKNDNTEVFVTMPSLNNLSLFGSGNINTSGSFNDNVNFNATIAGSGNINFGNGTTQNFYSNIAGSGNIYTLNMLADKAETTISGSGNTEITANSQLKVKISGSGNVYYKGSPVITTTISGSGAVIPR